MALQNDALPTFQEACQRAREVEKRLSSPPDGKIAGTIRVHEDSDIFPKEFEDYTYAYLLTEAQKMERQLSLTGYQPRQVPIVAPAPLPAQKAEEEKAEKELHQLATPRYLYPEKKDEAQFAEAASPSVLSRVSALRMPTILPFGKKPSSTDASAKTESSAASSSMHPSTLEVPPLPSQASASSQESSEALSAPAPAAQPFAPKLPPTIPRILPSRAIPPATQEEEAPIPQKDEREEEDLSLPKPGEEQLLPQEEKEDESVPLPPVAQSLTSSKISPRLRAIIEEKLKREEQRAAAEPGVKPDEIDHPLQEEEKESEAQESEEEPSPAKVRRVAPIVRARQKLPSRNAQKEEAAAEPDISPAEEETSLPAPKPEPVPKTLRRARDIAEGQPEEEKQAEETNEPHDEELEEAKEAPPAKEELQAAAKPSLAQRGAGLLIKPVFRDETGQEKQESAQSASPASEDSRRRLQRIQRIIDGLSSDKPQQKDGPDDSQPPPSAPAAKAKPRLRRSQEIGDSANAEATQEASPSSEEEAGAMPQEESPFPPQEKPALPQKKQQAKSSAKKVPAPPAPQAKAKAKQKGKKTAEATKGKATSIPLLPLPAAQPSPEKKSAKPLLQISPKGKAGAKGMPAEKAATPLQETPARTIMAQGRKAAPLSQAVPPSKQPSEARQFPAVPSRQVAIPSRENQQIASKAAQSQGARILPPRILPGGRVAPTVAPRTYVPAARSAAPAAPTYKPPVEEKEAPEGIAPSSPSQEEAIPAPAPEEREEKKPAGEMPQSDEGGAIEMRKPQIIPDVAPSPPAPGPEDDVPLPPELGRSKRTKEIAGKAALPEEDDLEIPAPSPDPEPPVPQSGEYDSAKGELRARLAQVDKVEQAKKEADDYLEQYAKTNIIWLYEIYKMGALPREEFLQKVKDNMASEGGAKKEEAAAENPALTNLGKQIDKKYNK